MNLDMLKPRIDGFVEFTRKFPAAYRPAIITYLLQLDASERGVEVGVAGAVQADLARSSAKPSGSVSPSNGNIHPAILEVAAEINVPAELVDRRLVTIVDGRPDIRWRSEDGSFARRQVEYAVVFTYVAEKLGEEGVRITELRKLSAQKRSYDMANFMANFKRQRDLLQLADVPGSKEQEVVLTGRGRQRARDLLVRAAQALPLVDIVGTPDIAETEVEGDEDQDTSQPELNLVQEQEVV